MQATIKTTSNLRSTDHAVAHVSSAAEAARYLGVSESAVRRECRRLGVKRIVGRVVAGFVVWESARVTLTGCVDVALSFAK